MSTIGSLWHDGAAPQNPLEQVHAACRVVSREKDSALLLEMLGLA
jgi:hypothetical protein